MDDGGYKWYVSAGVLLISTVICLCVFGWEGTLIRFFILSTIMAVAALGGSGSCGSAGGFLLIAMFVIDGFSGIPEGLASGFFCASLTLIAILATCDSDGPTGYVPRVKQPKTLKVELVDNRRRRRRRRSRRNGRYNSQVR